MARLSDLYKDLTCQQIVDFEAVETLESRKSRFGENSIDIEIPSILKIFYFDVFSTGSSVSVSYTHLTLPTKA